MLTVEEQKQHEKIQRCLRSDDAKALIEKIHDMCFRTMNQLKGSRDEVDIHRYQGRLEAWEQILKMKEE